jgi:hypothetical protein
LILFIKYFSDWRMQKKTLTWISASMGTYLAWLSMVVAFYFIIWPGMWVAPGKMIHEVYGNAFSYAFFGSRLSVSSGLEPAAINLANAYQSFLSILISIAWRTSPLTWIGLGLATGAMVIGGAQDLLPLMKWLVVFLLTAAFSSISMFALISGRDQPHYVMLAYVCLETIAGLGWVFAFRWLGSRFAKLGSSFAQASIFGALIAIQITGLIGFQPYFYTYYNPILRLANAGWYPRFFYGERMEAAAAYMSAKPDAQFTTALVYFGRSFSYYYPGDTLVFKPVFFEDRQQLQGVLRNSDYLVMYSGLQERLPLLKDMTPEHIIDLNGRPYVEIYRVSDVPPEFFAN